MDARRSDGSGTDAGFEAHLRVGDVSFDRDDATLLWAIDEHRSLNAAAESLGRSYSRAHERITALEAAAGPLVERRRGGPDGGGSELTGNARGLLARFARLQAALAGTTDAPEVVLDGTVAERDGELAVVETPAGPVRALLFEEADRVQVAFRADAVTLHAPDAVPPETGTSARNRFRGRVVAVERDESIARVGVEVDGAGPVSALITLDSLRTLGIAPGEEVVVSFKATATRATPIRRSDANSDG